MGYSVRDSSRRTVRSPNHERQPFRSDREKFKFPHINLRIFACPTGGARHSPKSSFAAKCNRGEVRPPKTCAVGGGLERLSEILVFRYIM